MTKKKQTGQKGRDRSKNSHTPTANEIANVLPHWGQIAFAARCARRVQPLLQPAQFDISLQQLKEIDRSIELVERAAAEPNAINIDAARLMKKSVSDAVGVLIDDGIIGDSSEVVSACNTIAQAIFVSLEDTGAATISAEDLAKAVASVAESAAYAAGSRQSANDNPFDSIRQDFDALAALPDSENWDSESLFPPEDFGPMWPNGVPEDWQRVNPDTGRLLSSYAAIYNEKVRAVVWDAVSPIISRVDEISETIDSYVESVARQTKLETEMRHQQEILKTRIQQAQNLISDKTIRVSTEKPVKYWEERAKAHELYFLLSGGLLVFYGLVSLVIACVVLYMAGEDLTISEVNPWRLGSAVLVATLLLLLLRVLTRIAMSNLHLATEARERVVMMQAYLALLKTEVVEKGEEDSESIGRPGMIGQHESMILSALFRPSTTGLVKDDAVPASVLDLATRVGNSSKGGN